MALVTIKVGQPIYIVKVKNGDIYEGKITRIIDKKTVRASYINFGKNIEHNFIYGIDFFFTHNKATEYLKKKMMEKRSYDRCNSCGQVIDNYGHCRCFD